MLCAELNTRILKLAPKHTASDTAPQCFSDLVAHSFKRLVVWSGASDKTIYGDPRINHAMRAWHDSIHIKLGADFSIVGETRVAIEQARLIGSDTMGKIILAEVVGQTKYFNRYGIFPLDQVKFVSNYLKGLYE